MVDYIYCATDPPVGAAGTQQLLLAPWNAIWYPPPRQGGQPSVHDPVWLVWRSGDSGLHLLGGGRVLLTDDGSLLWTNRAHPGVSQFARGLGYGGPSNMAFLRLENVVTPQNHLLVNLGQLPSKLSVASSQQAQLLTQVLPIP